MMNSSLRKPQIGDKKIAHPPKRGQIKDMAPPSSITPSPGEICNEHISQQREEIKSSRILSSFKDNVQEDLPSQDEEPRSFTILADHFLQFCTLFPENYEFEGDRLLQLYMASLPGFQSELTEIVFFKMFNEFVDSTLLQECAAASPKDTSATPRYKLHGDFYDLILEIVSFPHWYSRVKINKHEDSVRGALLGDDTQHVSLVFSSSDYGTNYPYIFEALSNKCPKLQTLLLLGQHKSLLDRIPSELFLKLKDLTVLDLSYTNISELPSSFSNLKSLRYLDVSGTRISRLPRSFSSFKGMQTLRVRDCFKLEGLPRDLNKLHELLHLDLDVARQLTSMPPRIGSLIKLQTLPAFIVSKDDGCHINELKDMARLRGPLSILKLENVSEGGDEAKYANLKQKEGLRQLELRWNKPLSSQYAEQVLMHLQPHTNIRELNIVGYAGSRFPYWFGDPCYGNLVSIAIYDCKCSTFNVYSLGQLPLLETLHIARMSGAKTISRDGDDEAVSTNEAPVLFPSLNSLVLQGLNDLEEWTGIKEGDFASLCNLKIGSCPKLTILPEMWVLVSLQILEISLCANLRSMPEKGLPPSLKSLLIYDSEKLREFCDLHCWVVSLALVLPRGIALHQHILSASLNPNGVFGSHFV